MKVRVRRISAGLFIESSRRELFSCLLILELFSNFSCVSGQFFSDTLGGYTENRPEMSYKLDRLNSDKYKIHRKAQKVEKENFTLTKL